MSTSKNSPNQDNQSDSQLKKQENNPSAELIIEKQATNQTSTQLKPRFTRFASFVVLGNVFLLIGMVLGALAIQQFGDNSSSKNESTFTDNKASDSKDSDKKDNSALEQEQTPVLTVETIRPQLNKVANKISIDGTLTAKNTASISAKVNGLAIRSIMVQEGQWVNKGDVLATFDTQKLTQNAIQFEANVRQAQAGVKQAKANVVQAEVNLVKSQADLDRVLPLLKIGAVSHQSVDSYKAQLAQSKASLVSAKQRVASAKEAVISAQAQLNNQKINLIDSQLRSPVSGIISNKNAEVGSIPQGALFTIIEDGRLDWKADLNPEQARKLKIGMPVMVKVSDKHSIRGKVSRFASVAGSNRQIPVYVTLENNQGVQAGMLLTGEFFIGVENKTILPVSAITSNDGHDYLMSVSQMRQDKDNQGHPITIGRIKRIKVELGRQENNAVIIKTPLPQGVAVVRQSGGFLAEGDVVRVVKVKGQ